ncbi:stabilin-2 isoform X2 [Oryzias latipes]|uniref:stabilin-2 isoform X2 n=1 Tax=Oryzias latipes TaxID=8090 RepID=UPI000CE2291C|nr:stabilin-2 isoform X2 [Oryzias latipes]
MEVHHKAPVLIFFLIGMTTTAGSVQNLCPKLTLLRTQTACNSCQMSFLITCPSGYKKTPRSPISSCRYVIKTNNVMLAVPGCSFECYREVEVPSCCPGYWGPDCMECPRSSNRPCSSRGTCSDGLGGNGTCSCQEGFAGTACEDCATGHYGPTCQSVCSCVHGLCSSGLKGDGRCTCFSGYKGPNCDQELPECSALNCQQNSRCVEDSLTGRLECRCSPGYEKAGLQCVSVNPCLQPVCHTDASCIHTGPNQHLCACNQGFSGDGRVCMPVDPCQTQNGGCAPESTSCVFTGPGQSRCDCLPGFENLSGGGCALKDACKPASCHQNANCSTVGPGEVQCTCLQGYIGNGRVCYGNIMQRLMELNTEPEGRWMGQLSNAISMFGSLSWPLQNFGPFTIFVPINKGFRGLSVKSLTAEPSKAKYLCRIHLAAGLMPSDTLTKTAIFYTLTGKSAEIDSPDMDGQPRIRIHGSRKKGNIIQSDLVASNGIIHIINKLMDSISPTVESNPDENLMKIISDNGKFETFRTLLQKTDLASLMDLPGHITVFAPTTTALDAMTEGYLQYLTSVEGHSKLVEFIRNHVVSSLLEVYHIVSSPTVVTVANHVLMFNVTENGQILVNGAAVTEAAVEAKNGRLYVMDGVLIPASIEPVLPHRCDIPESKITKGKCARCSKITPSVCPSGVFVRSLACFYNQPIASSIFTMPERGCLQLCNTTVMTPACCKGFYGPECKPCPGGFQSPCSGHGQCVEGIAGNGSCLCETNFRGSRCQYCSAPNKYGLDCDRTCPCIHGQCDNRPSSDGRCKLDSCAPGYTGHFCERKASACGIYEHFCHAYADCDLSQGTPKCLCKPGFHGDGITCVEMDPCAPPLRGGCSSNAKCIKTGPASHICKCLTGWMEDGDECQPVNNCNAPDRGGCHPNATCIFVGPGQSDCSCKSGFKGDGETCEPVNQCVTAEGGCHYLASCRLLSSQWRCVCHDEYVGNGQVCYGTVEQQLLVLPSASDFSTWIIKSGLPSLLSDQNFTLFVPTTSAIAGMPVEDRRFWSLRENLPSLIRNHMVSGTCLLSCLEDVSSVTSLLKTTLSVSQKDQVTFVGGATIITSDIAATNGVMHLINKVLVPDRKRSEGLLAMLGLRPELSLIKSYLMEYNLTQEIEQTGEFTVFAPTDAAIQAHLKTTGSTALDVNTTRYHMVASQRLLRTDLQHGGYKQTLLGFSFQLGIFPRDGKIFVNDAQINSFNILSGNGVIHTLSAVLPISRNRCDKLTYQRVPGLCVPCLFHQNKICPNNTVPEKSKDWRKCALITFDQSRQLRLRTGCRATCLQKSVEQRCCAGFFGEHCEPCPGSAGKPCFGNGLCLDGTNGTGVCRCNRGFNGTACETCEGGRYGIHCDQECECKNGRCSEGLGGDGTCQCDVGWRGVHCDEKIESGAEEFCGLEKCHSSANCVTRASGPECLCAAGFEGNGTFCKSVDPCLVDYGGCSPFAVCKRTRHGRRDCICSRGYAGDGLVCVEINPCLEGNGGCHSDAQCIHVGPNQASCVCPGGFSGDGRSCSRINLCEKRNGGCHVDATCNMTARGFVTCKCKKLFVGDGLRCKGTVNRELRLRGLTSFYFAVNSMEISLRGRGPFTVFAPKTQTFESDSSIKMKLLAKHKEAFRNLLRSHIVMCCTLLPTDLSLISNVTSLSGLVLSVDSTKGSIFINEANVTDSDDVSVNGIIHEIDRILFPPNMDKDSFLLGPDPAELNLTDVTRGYKTFFKLLQDTGVLELVNDGVNHPVTVFMPSDATMASLPQEQKDFLFHQQNRKQLLEYLKFHILPNQKLYAEDLIYLDSGRTLQGSALSFSCGGAQSIGEIFINDQSCRILQRHLIFKGGIAYGIDCLLTPPSQGGRCDVQTTFDLQMGCGMCTSSLSRCPRGSKQKELQKCDLPNFHVSKNSGCRSVCTVNFWQPKCCPGYYGRDCLVCPGGIHSPCSNRGKCDDGHLGNGTCTCQAGFGGTACNQCKPGFYGPTCKACKCSAHGSCDEGVHGSGLCFCERGWTGEQCDEQQTEVFECSPACSPKAICKDNNTCVCRSFHQGDGFTCTVMDVCSIWNGGCAKEATCSQEGENVNCTCLDGHSGDGFTCVPVDPCSFGDNGGCHEHATCIMTAPGKKKCACKDNYLGDGVSCELMQIPVSRCLQDNGGCHSDARCSDLHFEDKLFGVFHVRSKAGQYKLTYAAAQQVCIIEGGSLATLSQLHHAQQGGLNMCAAGWLDQARVAYPTTYSNPKCGFGHVGIVDYGFRKNLSETWDGFCYRMKDVECQCKPGYIGDGFGCAGNLMQVLKSTPSFSNFLTQILNYSQTSKSGRQFVKRLGDPAVQSTLFVPDNSGLPSNQTLSQRDIEFHLSEGQALPISQLKNGTRIRTRVGGLTVLGVADLLDPSSLASRYVNEHFIIDSNIQASNGLIHVLLGPLKAPPPNQEMHVAHQAGVGVGAVLLALLMVGVAFVAYHFYRQRSKPFQFHYFKEEDGDASATATSSRSICNPVYEDQPSELHDEGPISSGLLL